MTIILEDQPQPVEDVTPKTRIKYPVPLLNAIGDGAAMDVRVKFAMALMQAPGFFTAYATETSRDAAVAALDLSEALYSEAAHRGWIESLPTDHRPNAEELAHARRNAETQAAGQVHGQLSAQAYVPKVVPTAAHIMGGRAPLRS